MIFICIISSDDSYCFCHLFLRTSFLLHSVHSVTLAALDSPVGFQRSSNSSSSASYARQTLRRVFPSMRRATGKDSAVSKEHGLSGNNGNSVFIFLSQKAERIER